MRGARLRRVGRDPDAPPKLGAPALAVNWLERAREVLRGRDGRTAWRQGPERSGQLPYVALDQRRGPRARQILCPEPGRDRAAAVVEQPVRRRLGRSQDAVDSPAPRGGLELPR